MVSSNSSHNDILELLISKVHRYAERMIVIIGIMLRVSTVYTSPMTQKLLTVLLTVLTTRAASSDQPSPALGQLLYSVHFLTLGNIAYFMGSLNTERSVYERMEKRVADALRL